MAENTGISWADSTYNPWIGCTKVSPACDNCYAEREDERRHFTPEGFGAGKPRKRTKTTFKDVMKWQRDHIDFFAKHGRRRRIFCASLADVFDNEVPEDWRADLWKLVDDCPDLLWMILTKRIGNVPKMLPANWQGGYQNVMLMATVCNAKEAHRDVPKLQATAARWRGLSVEPMLSGVSLARYLAGPRHLDLVIAGGESMKPGMEAMARAVNPIWPRILRDDCARDGVAFHFKQWGEWSDAIKDKDEDRGAGKVPYPVHTFLDGAKVALLGCDKTGRSIDGVIHDAFPADFI